MGGGWQDEGTAFAQQFFNKLRLTGFGVGEKEVQYLIDDGTIGIFCNGATRRFGKNIASWDAEEIIKRIEKFTGNNLTLDDKTEQFLEDIDDMKTILSHLPSSLLQTAGASLILNVEC